MYSSVCPVVSSCADVGTVVCGINWVVTSICSWLLLVVVVPFIETCGTKISGLVEKICFLVMVCTVVGPAIRVAVLDEELEVGPRV